MRFRTRELDLSTAIDETFLRLGLIGLCIVEAVWSICIIGFIAAVIGGLSNADADVPRKATATIVIACICTVYTGLSIFPIFFGGVRFFTVSAILNTLFLAAWATLIGVWDHDGTGSCRAFQQRYFGDQPEKGYFSTDCKLVKAMFAFMIVNLVSFLASAVISFCLRMIELDYAMSWRSLPLMDRFEKRGRRQHCACCKHDKTHPSPDSSTTRDHVEQSV
jgi:hypothetical protein